MRSLSTAYIDPGVLYDALIEEWRHLGKCPKYYLTSIMRKESGFDPHVLSYADAIGLLQMIPPTTKRVVKELGMKYSADLLYDPILNIKTASWPNSSRSTLTSSRLARIPLSPSERACTKYHFWCLQPRS